MNITSIIALIVATVIPLIVLYIIYTRDFYGTGAFSYVILCFVWGGVAFAFAYLINSYLISNGIIERLTVIRVVAPIEEEILKGLILIYLIRRPQFTYFVDGAIYGFAVGIGFAIFENYYYIWGDLGALSIAIQRVISVNLVHATGSAIIGIAFGLARFSRLRGRIVQVLTGLALAAALHAVFNNLVTTVSRGLDIVFAVIIGFIGLSTIWATIKRGLAEEKAWIEETLGMADRVTPGEAEVVHRITKVDEILEPLAMRFGKEKASQIEKFIKIQAKLGILRKTLEKLQDENLLEDARKEMALLRQEMDAVRKSVGTYTMMYLRGIFMEEDSQLWGSLERGIIEERLISHPVPEGGGLWGKLDEVIKPPNSLDE